MFSNCRRAKPDLHCSARPTGADPLARQILTKDVDTPPHPCARATTPSLGVCIICHAPSPASRGAGVGCVCRHRGVDSHAVLGRPGTGAYPLPGQPGSIHSDGRTDALCYAQASDRQPYPRNTGIRDDTRACDGLNESAAGSRPLRGDCLERPRGADRGCEREVGEHVGDLRQLA
jgi:hypothetical protein